MFNQNPTVGPGTETYTSHSLEIILMLLGAFILGYLLRFFIKPRPKSIDNPEIVKELSDWKTKYTTLSTENDDLNSKFENLKVVSNDLRFKVAESLTLRSQITELENQLKEKENTTPTANDSAELAELKEKLEMSSALNLDLYNQIITLRKKNDEQTLKMEAMPNTQNIEPPTKPANGNEIKTSLKDDLKLIEGIGPKIEKILNESGIWTFKQIASVSIDKLKDIVFSHGDQYKIHDPGTWPEQSRLADAGEWDKLKAMQIEMKSGKLN